ncbi:MAG: hypothetical protein NC905_02655 [Candidatus Omnitrophica bacterium]|nr:hypothetical protein [Candidatus Omnitrophota bacterium]MCM8777152.1 hypothetical protein [Candidatus Omnitrophota bacterium]
MESDNFNEIEKILGEIKKDSDKYCLKGDIITKTSYILKEKQQKSLFYYKEILGTAVVLLLIFNIFQGTMLLNSRRQVNMIGKQQILHEPSVLVTPTVIDRPSTLIKIEPETQQKQICKGIREIETIREEKKETKQELIYVSTKEISEMLELYDLFNKVLSPVILEQSYKKEGVYEAI